MTTKAEEKQDRLQQLLEWRTRNPCRKNLRPERDCLEHELISTKIRNVCPVWELVDIERGKLSITVTVHVDPLFLEIGNMTAESVASHLETKFRVVERTTGSVCQFVVVEKKMPALCSIRRYCPDCER